MTEKIFRDVDNENVSVSSEVSLWTGHMIRASLLDLHLDGQDYRERCNCGRYLENYKTKSINVLSKSLARLHGVFRVAGGNNFIQICNFVQFTFLGGQEDCQSSEQCQSNYGINSPR